MEGARTKMTWGTSAITVLVGAFLRNVSSQVFNLG